TILPPRGLYLPVLGSKVKMGADTKLIFTLCSACAKQKLDVACCNHTDQEHVLKHQSYYTPELFKALEKGYKILDVDEVWHWPADKRSNILFCSFMLKWLKVKICTSGYPAGCNSKDDRLNFVSKLNKHYSFETDILPAEIVKNPVSKTLGKNNLNCTWGRFGMITNH
ncbi:hypothetical protein, partial [Pseudoalteromonas sp.]|uniref:hypothetical protein n=1 Tax=Pseudoalteromonas sp. TaxID=53249 RepID=UPI00262C25E4